MRFRLRACRAFSCPRTTTGLISPTRSAAFGAPWATRELLRSKIRICFPGLVERNAEGVLILLSDQDGNLSGSLNESVDVEVRMNFSSSYGDFVAGMQATRTLTLEETAAPGVEPLSRQGNAPGPAGNASQFFIWTGIGRTGRAGVTIRHSSDYENTDEQALRRDVSSYTTVDVQGTYHLYDAGWRVTLGIENLFDKEFPFVDNFQGVDSSRVDFRRRVVVLDVKKEFTW